MVILLLVNQKEHISGGLEKKSFKLTQIRFILVNNNRCFLLNITKRATFFYLSKYPTKFCAKIDLTFKYSKIWLASIDKQNID